MDYTEYTLDAWISTFRDEQVTVDTTVFKYAISDGTAVKVFPDESILGKYSNELEELLTRITLTKKEYQIYEYNPHSFAYHLYGNANLWFLILYANELHSVTEFTINPIKVYNPAVIRLLNRIILTEQERIDANAQEVNDVITNRTVINQ